MALRFFADQCVPNLVVESSAMRDTKCSGSANTFGLIRPTRL